MHRSSLICSALALALAGCDGGDLPVDGGDPPVDGGLPDTDGSLPEADGGPPQPTGDASLSFSPTWDGADAQFQGINWQAILDLSIFQPASEEARDHRVVIMLCEPSDTTCESPVLTREITADETDGDPIQDNFGPEIVATGLPAGDYALMIFVDSGISRSRGFAWDSGFDTDETAWGGVVSELDVMLSDEEVSPGVTPPPATLAITLTDGATTELGTLTLQHVHERDISPEPNSEAGVMAVAVAEGLRLIDTSTNELIEVAPGFYTHEMVDGSGSTVGGTVCGMIDGPDDTVFLMYEDSSVGAGFAIQFDIGDRAQLHGGNRIELGDAGQPCRGRYHDGHLYVTNATGSRRNVAETAAEENLWVADVAALAGGDVTATLLDRADDPILQYGVDDIAASGSTLYLTINGTNSTGGLPAECVGSYCVFSASIGSDGVPTLDSGAGYTYWVGPEIAESYPTAMGDVDCPEEASAWAAIQVADFHDGRTLLFLGACLEIAVFDTSDGSELDLGVAPNTQGMDGTLFGQAFNTFAMSPDGQTLWAVPMRLSPIPFYMRQGIDTETRSDYARYMAMPIDLSTGAQPALHPDYTGDDIDDYEGPTPPDYTAPAADPGVDINLGWYTEYRTRWLPSTSGFQPASFPYGSTIAVTNQSLWLRGAGNAEAGASGMGKSGNLGVYDLETRRMILFPYDDAGFYRFWHGGAESDPYFGFDLTPESDMVIATFGLRFIPGS